ASCSARRSGRSASTPGSSDEDVRRRGAARRAARWFDSHAPPLHLAVPSARRNAAHLERFLVEDLVVGSTHLSRSVGACWGGRGANLLGRGRTCWGGGERGHGGAWRAHPRGVLGHVLALTRSRAPCGMK